MTEHILVLDQIKKGFDQTPVLMGIDLKVAPGEFITLLGSSGCGKTTTLRIIAGLETPDNGRVWLNGQDVTDTEPNKRDVNTVFQNYALFPHMTVAQNVAYSLRLKRKKKDQIAKEVTEALQLVQLSGYESRMPSELSGGQRQRVAIARALVNKPHLLLLDEPLGALDLQLRRQMQIELKKLQKQLGITFIYITHDQEEALNMSDRIAVMRDGYLEQVGTPAEIYDQPRSSYVAQFVGNANIIKGIVTEQDDNMIMAAICDSILPAQNGGYQLALGTAVTLAIRSEHIQLKLYEEGDSGLCATITESSFAGGMLRLAIRLADSTEVIASRHGIDIGLRVNDQVTVSWLAADAIPVDVEVAADED